ncbi:MAG: penicillin-binding protein [Firmicutes bacterium]|nr:penicillin-binding protein [Bacillota bacterium]
MNKKRTVKISIFVILVLIASFFVVIFQLFRIALMPEVDGVDIAAFAKNRNETTKTLYASRGTIYDQYGETLAQTVNSYTVIAYLSPSRTKDENKPNHVVDKEETAKKLAETFQKNNIKSMTYEHILELLNRSAYQVELGPGGRGITEFLKSEIEALELPGIGFTQSTKRYYKNSTLAPYIIGYARANDEGKITGEMGIEKYFNDELEGEDGFVTYETDAYGYRLPNSPETRVEAQSGKDIYLTIDSHIQLFLLQAVQNLVDNYKMDWLTFTVADAKTGAILGSASEPTFDLNKQNITNYLNPMVSYAYEPGSTMKIYSFMAAIENGQYDGTETYQSGSLEVDGYVIHDFNDVGWGVIDYDTGFARSSNTAAGRLAQRIGGEKLRDFYEAAGFGEQTGITLPGEQAGNLDFYYGSEVVTASFGQGITTTPIQNIQALTMLANNGTILQPYVVDKIVDSKSGKVEYQAKRTEVRKVASEESINKVRSLMDKALYDTITDAKYYQPSNIRMIGKTGTANFTQNGVYMSGKYDYIRSFAGLFPAEDPQYIVYISVKQFVGPIKELAKVVTTVVEDIANYKNIANLETTNTNEQIIVFDNYINTSVVESEEKLKQMGLNPIILGDGKYIINIYPKKGTKVIKGTKIFMITSNNNIAMPDITNWSESEVKTFASLVGIECNINGYGKVVSQSIEKNTIIDSTSVLNVELN